MNINKNLLDQVFCLSDKDDVFSFLKDYAYRDVGLGATLVRHFLPDEVDVVSLRTEVQSILWSVEESGLRWGPSMDWNQIDDHLGRMMKKARYYDGEGQFEAAASIASEVILFVGEHYADDSVYESDRFDGYDFGAREAVSLLISLIESDVLNLAFIREIRNDVERAARTDTFRDGGYYLADLDELQSVMDGVFDDFNEHLASLDRRIEKAGRSVDERNRWLKRKVAYLYFKGKGDVAEEVIDNYFFVPELSKMRIDSQVFQGHIEDAIVSLDRAIECSDDRLYLDQCHERKYKLLESLGDEVRIADELEYLILNSYSSKYDYYLKFKEILRRLPDNPTGRISNIVETLVSKKRDHSQAEIARICAEEKMIPQLCKCLSWNDNFGNDCYQLLADYGNLLESSQRWKIVEGHIEIIRRSAVFADYRRYGFIVNHMASLMESCEEGRRAVDALVKEFESQYSRRPSMMRELQKLNTRE